MITRKKFKLFFVGGAPMPESLTEQLISRKKYLETLIKEKNDALSKAPEGRLRFMKDGEKIRYYHRTDPRNPTGTYIKIKDISLAAALSQKDYDEKIVKSARKELYHLNQLISFFAGNTINNVYENLDLPRRRLITPISPSDEEFLAAWNSVTWQPKPFENTKNEYYTGKGERVRSKSEILIADTFARFGVPYRYEYPTNVGGTVLYPDFTVLNIRKRKEYIWEHLGMLGQAKYAGEAVNRIERLEFNGYFPGENLILTMETEDTPLNTKLVAQLIKRYLL